MTPEAARDRSQIQILRVITCSGIPQNSKWEGMNDPRSHQKSKIGGHFCKMCTYDPMFPSSATPGHHWHFGKMEFSADLENTGKKTIQSWFKSEVK